MAIMLSSFDVAWAQSRKEMLAKYTDEMKASKAQKTGKSIHLQFTKSIITTGEEVEMIISVSDRVTRNIDEEFEGYVELSLDNDMMRAPSTPWDISTVTGFQEKVYFTKQDKWRKSLLLSFSKAISWPERFTHAYQITGLPSIWRWRDYSSSIKVVKDEDYPWANNISLSIEWWTKFKNVYNRFSQVHMLKWDKITLTFEALDKQWNRAEEYQWEISYTKDLRSKFSCNILWLEKFTITKADKWIKKITLIPQNNCESWIRFSATNSMDRNVRWELLNAVITPPYSQLDKSLSSVYTQLEKKFWTNTEWYIDFLQKLNTKLFIIRNDKELLSNLSITKMLMVEYIQESVETKINELSE